MSSLPLVPAVINWKVIPGLLKDIAAASKDTVWGIDGQDRALCLVKNKLEYVADERKIVSISCGESGVWAVDNKGIVVYRDGVSPSEPKGTLWSEIPLESDLAKQVDVGSKGQVCVVSRSNLIFCRSDVNSLNPKGAFWNEKRGKLSHISCGGLGCWGIGARGRHVWFRTNLDQSISATTKWEKIKDAPMSTIKAGADGSVWAINGNGYLFARQGVSSTNPQGDSWVRVALSKQFQSISVAEGVLFGVSTTGAVYECKFKLP